MGIGTVCFDISLCLFTLIASSLPHFFPLIEYITPVFSFFWPNFMHSESLIYTESYLYCIRTVDVKII